MLSNTATPIYYGRFREQVTRGEIPVNEYVMMEMNRIDALIEDPDVYYDPDAIKGFIKFCEAELTLTNGDPLQLLETFKLWAEQIFGWWWFDDVEDYIPPTATAPGRTIYRQVKRRLVNKQYLIVARGAAKSMYASCLQSYFLNIDVSTTHQITTAPTMKQAEEVLSPIRTAIQRARGPFFKYLTEGSLQNTTGNRADRVKLASTKKGIENFLTGSIIEIRPMTINKLQGLRTKVNTVDEWLSGDLREDVVGALTQGAEKIDDWLVVCISSEGTVRNGAGDSMKMELMDILKGKFPRPDTSIWYYRLDNVEEVNHPEKWKKANPNLGITVKYADYQKDVQRSIMAPASANDILAKRFGIPMEGYTYFFTYEETLPLERMPDMRMMPCAMGADLSQGDDFCAFTFLFPLPRDEFGVKTRSYITRKTFDRLQPAARQKYQQFIDEDSLIIMDANVLDMKDVYDDLNEHIIKMQYEVLTLGFDPYNSKEFINSWELDNTPYNIEKVPQGARTESVPLGELKHLSESGLLLFDEALMQYAMGNAITIEDNNGNRKLLKKRHEEKIDNVAALMDAWVAYKLHKEEFE